MLVVFCLVAGGDELHAHVDEEGDEEQDHAEQEQRLVVRSAGRRFSKLGRDGRRDGAQRFQNRVGNHCGVARDHQHCHGLTHRAADSEHHSRGDSRHRGGNHHLVDGLPLVGPERQAGLPERARAVAHRVLRDRHDGRQSHDGEHQAACETAFADGQAEHALQHGDDYYEAEEAVDNRGDAVQQLDHRLQEIAYAGRRHLGHVDRYADAEGQGEQNREQADPERAEQQREHAEQGRRGGRGEPFAAGEDLSGGDRVVLDEVQAGVFGNHGLGHEGHHSGVGGHQPGDQGASVFILGAELLFSEVLVGVLEPEGRDRDVRAAELLPVGHVLVEHSLDLGGVEFPDRVLPVEGEHVAFLNHRFAEQSGAFGEEETYYQKYYDAGHEAAGGQQPFHRLFEESFHCCSSFTGMKPCSSTDSCPSGESTKEMKGLTSASFRAS